jgi:integrase
MHKKRLTDVMIGALKAPKSGQRLVWDSEPGFVVRVAASGRKFFLYDYYVNGKRRRMSIGEWSIEHFPVATARARVAEFRTRINQGTDPLADQHAAAVARKGAPTLRDLEHEWNEYAALHKRLSSRSGDAAMFRRYIIPTLGADNRLATITRRDIELLQRAMRKDGAPIAANRMLSLMSSAMNRAIANGWLEKNPVKGIKRTPEEPRERYLNDDELARLDAELNLAQHQPDRAAGANIVRLLVLTGARRGEVLKARWDEFSDLDGPMPTWTKPSAHTKQKKLHRVPLNPPAVEVLRAMRSQRGDSPYLFPNLDDPQRPATDLKYLWRGLCKRAGLEGLRLHDLRHAFASFLINKGIPLATIGQLLGHTRAETTERYAHLADKVLREATGKMAEVMPPATMLLQ